MVHGRGTDTSRNRIWNNDTSRNRISNRVHSIWNHTVRAIYPEFTNDIPGTHTLEEENSWRSAFYRKREKVRDGISCLREPIDPLITPKVRKTY